MLQAVRHANLWCHALCMTVACTHNVPLCQCRPTLQPVAAPLCGAKEDLLLHGPSVHNLMRPLTSTPSHRPSVCAACPAAAADVVPPSLEEVVAELNNSGGGLPLNQIRRAIAVRPVVSSCMHQRGGGVGGWHAAHLPACSMCTRTGSPPAHSQDPFCQLNPAALPPAPMRRAIFTPRLRGPGALEAFKKLLMQVRALLPLSRLNRAGGCERLAKHAWVWFVASHPRQARAREAQGGARTATTPSLLLPCLLAARRWRGWARARTGRALWSCCGRSSWQSRVSSCGGRHAQCTL